MWLKPVFGSMDPGNRAQTSMAKGTGRPARNAIRQPKMNLKRIMKLKRIMGTPSRCLSTSGCASSAQSQGNTTEPPIENPPPELQEMPDEILIHIFSHLTLQDLAQSAYVCRRWHGLVKGRESLWRRKVFHAGDFEKAKQVRAVTSIMPKLKLFRLLMGQRSVVHIAWPEATVVLHRFAFDVPEYQCTLPTDTLLVSRLVADYIKHFLDWVDPLSLRVMYVGEQCIDSVTDSMSPFVCYVESTLCDFPDCILHTNNPSLYQVPLGRRRSLPGTDEWLCPSLEQLTIRCGFLSEECLHLLCQLGPKRVLRVMLHILESLSFLSYCPSQLEVLNVREAPELPSDPTADVYAI